MKIIKLKNKNINYKDFIKRSAEESDYEKFIDYDCIGIDEKNEIKFIYLKLKTNPNKIIQALNKIKYNESTRTGGLKTRSRIFGFMPRRAMRADYCTSTSLSRESPQEHQIIADYAEQIEKIYSEKHPDGWKKHKKLSEDNVKDSYKINKKSLFTSGIINKNNQLNYHFDSGNFKEVYSCMLVFKNKVSGGFLSLPEYDCGIELDNNTLFMFDGQSILHGVTPIKYQEKNSFRYSIVYYSLQSIWKCLELDEEILRIRKIKTEQARKKINKDYKEKMMEKYYQKNRK